MDGNCDRESSSPCTRHRRSRAVCLWRNGGAEWGVWWSGPWAKVLVRFCRRLPQPLGWLVEAVLLKQTVALHGLARAAQAVYRPLMVDDEVEARRQLSWHLVSRDTATLDTPRIAAATIESVAENSSDGVIAPLFYYAALGLPGAFVYRWLNTVDSLWGYRDPAREWLGKSGARADDVANWVPARLTAVLLMAAAWLFGDARAGVAHLAARCPSDCQSQCWTADEHNGWRFGGGVGEGGPLSTGRWIGVARS